MFVAFKPKSERGPSNEVIQRLRRDAERCHRHGGVLPDDPKHQRREAQINKSEYQYTLQSSDTDTLYRLAPELRDKNRQAIEGSARRYHRPLHQESAGHDRGRPRKGGRLRDYHRSVRQELYDAFGARQVATDLHCDQRLPGHPGGQARIPDRPFGLSKIYVKTNGGGTATGGAGGAGLWRDRKRDSGRTIDPAFGGDQARVDGRAAAGQPPGPAAFGYHLVQSGAQIFARRRGSMRSEKIERELEPSSDDHDQFPGDGAGVPGIAEGPGDSGPGGDLRRLRGAGYPLRELHPSDHHHFRPAVGGRRRACWC